MLINEINEINMKMNNSIFELNTKMRPSKTRPKSKKKNKKWIDPNQYQKLIELNDLTKVCPSLQFNKTNSSQIEITLFYYFLCLMSLPRIPDYPEQILLWLAHIGFFLLFIIFIWCRLKTKTKYKIFYFRPMMSVFFSFSFWSMTFFDGLFYFHPNRIYTK